MGYSRSSASEKLAIRTIAAHRAYLDALGAWERALHTISCERCRPQDVSTESLNRIAEQIEAEKECRRIAFRDLANELGYVPTGEGIALPEQEPGCPGHAGASPDLHPSST
ncbi:MAG TPA: transcriptional repressor TraM [Bosea sp. (in: a-proteobacteria)]|nr:transcriptional repressor TraM [Bosea sp. (in: a-proteobacteria)]